MPATAVQIAAARRFAPPLITLDRLDKRGAKLRQVNRRAVDYAHRAGLSVEEVYPEGLWMLRALAPAAESVEAGAFMRTTGLRSDELYPPFGGEMTGKRGGWRWGWAVVGALVGAALVGPIGAVAGGILGGAR